MLDPQQKQTFAQWFKDKGDFWWDWGGIVWRISLKADKYVWFFGSGIFCQWGALFIRLCYWLLLRGEEYSAWPVSKQSQPWWRKAANIFW